MRRALLKPGGTSFVLSVLAAGGIFLLVRKRGGDYPGPALAARGSALDRFTERGDEAVGEVTSERGLEAECCAHAGSGAGRAHARPPGDGRKLRGRPW